MTTKQKIKEKMPKKLYTLSTLLFASKADAEAQILKFANNSGLREGSMVMEVTKIFEINVKKVVSLKDKKDAKITKVKKQKIDDSFPF